MKIRKIKVKYLVNLDNYISEKESTLLFLIAILSVIPSVLSGNQNLNLWERVIETMNNPLTNVMIFWGIVIIISCVKKHICYNELFFSRFNNSRELLTNGIIAITVSILIFYIVFILLAFGGATFFSFGNYKLGIYEKYNVSVLLYVFFKFIKNVIVYELISILVFLLLNLIKKMSIKYLLLLSIVAFFFFPYGNRMIVHFYQIPITFQRCLLETNFISFYTELSVTMIYIFILVFVLNILLKFSIKRKFNSE